MKGQSCSLHGSELDSLHIRFSFVAFVGLLVVGNTSDPSTSWWDLLLLLGCIVKLCYKGLCLELLRFFFFFACSLAIPGKRAPSLKGNRERVDLEEWRLWGDLQMWKEMNCGQNVMFESRIKTNLKKLKDSPEICA